MSQCGYIRCTNENVTCRRLQVEVQPVTDVRLNGEIVWLNDRSVILVVPPRPLEIVVQGVALEFDQTCKLRFLLRFRKINCDLAHAIENLLIDNL